MRYADLYRNVVVSLQKLVLNFIAAEAPEATYFNWDSHGSISEMPAGTLVGPAGCGLSDEEKAMEVVFAVGIATNDDPNNFNLTRLISTLYGDYLAPESRLDVWDQDTVEKTSWMVIKRPVAITPVTRAEIRCIQFVECRALLDLAAAS